VSSDPASSSSPFRDAEAWLAERGVEREPIRVAAPPVADEPGGSEPRASTPGAVGDVGEERNGAGTDAGAPGAAGDVSATQAVRLAGQAAADRALRESDAAASADHATPRLEDDVAAALAFIRRSTANAPQSVGRLRDKLRQRGTPTPAIEQALRRARSERFVDDDAMAAALVEERRRKGHAVARIRRDLHERGFEAATIDAVLAPTEREDPEAAAFAVAAEKAERLTGLTTETALRRVIGHLIRRGYPDGLARKVAREAVFASRDPERTAGH
jgi:regulatory protein